MKDDPMYQDIDCDGFVGFSKLYNMKSFAITNESFIPLINSEYNLRAATDKQFSVIVSKSCYRYVMILHLYARYAQLRNLRGDSEHIDEVNLLNYLKEKAYLLPPAIDTYLRSIGDLPDHKVVFPAWPNETGDFGKISELNHWQYMSYPAPRIFAQAIVSDLRYTTGADQVCDWNLPMDLRPDAIGDSQPGLPTVNLLGWDRAMKLSSDQRTHIEDAGITIDSFGGRGMFCLNPTLIEKVHNALNNSSTTVKLSNGLCESPYGSVGQLLYYQKNLKEALVFSRTEYYLETEIRGVAAECVQQLTKYIVMHGHIFSLRVEKETSVDGDINLRTWAIYDWNNYANVPDAWNATANTVFTYGSGNQFNLMDFTTPFTGRDNIRTALLRQALVVKQT